MSRKVPDDRPIGRTNLRPSVLKTRKTFIKQCYPPLAKDKQKSRLCQVRIERGLLETIRNVVQSAKAGGDFRYGNVSDFIRSALIAYKNGMKLVEGLSVIDRQMQGTTVWMDDTLHAFWQTLPRGCRREILERALWAKLKQM